MELIIAREDYTMFGPILSGNDGDTYGGRPYVRLMSSPYVYFVTWDKPSTKNLHKLLTALKGAWPLLCVILLLAVEAGILIWLTVREFYKEYPT